MTGDASISGLELYEAIRTAVDHLDHALDLLGWAHHEGHQLLLGPAMRALDDTRRGALAEALAAAEALALDQPLAEAFPNGQPRPPRLTPRQVLYLRDLAAREAGASRRQARGLGPARRCQATRADGQGCAAWALRWTDRAVCATHASSDERRANHDANQTYLSWLETP